MEIDRRATKLFAVFSILNLSIMVLTAVAITTIGLVEGLIVFATLMVVLVSIVSKYYSKHSS
ncbi:MAG: hypothetical protein H8Z69_01355 [Nanohaloarchaea archaeon]|nr:hypothetical protein [Candidatus Nanohaloarchaea archaeon]